MGFFSKMSRRGGKKSNIVPESTIQEGDGRSSASSSRQTSFDVSRHPRPSEVGKPQQPSALLQRRLSDLETSSYRREESNSDNPPLSGQGEAISDPKQMLVQKEIDKANEIFGDNIRAVADKSNQRLEERGLISRDEEQQKRKYRQIKQAIEGDWALMRTVQPPEVSGRLTLEYKALRNRKGELHKDPKFLDDLENFHTRRMFANIENIEEIKKRSIQQNWPELNSNRPLGMSLYQLSKSRKELYSTILPKLNNLSPEGLGPGGEKENLIRMFEVINAKYAKTVKKLEIMGALTAASVVLTALTTTYFAHKKHSNLLRSGQMYDGWMRDLNRRLNSHQAQNQENGPGFSN